MEIGMAAVTGRSVCSSLPISSLAAKPSNQSFTLLSSRKSFADGFMASANWKIVERNSAQSLHPISVTKACSNGEEHGVHSGPTKENQLNLSSIPRREVLGKAISLVMCTMALPALAAEEDFTVYEDKVEKYSLLVPPEWTKGEGKAGTRKVTAFYPENDASANVNIIITDLGADYTQLGSFGPIDAFAENLVNSLDRAWKKPKGQAAKLVDSRAKNGMYYIEYTIQQPGENKRHLLSVVGIASNGWIQRLYTVTGQYWEDDGDKYKANLQKAVSSFRFL